MEDILQQVVLVVVPFITMSYYLLNYAKQNLKYLSKVSTNMSDIEA
jgi:hypothetical protein